MRTTNIVLLYPNVHNNIGGDIPIDVPQAKYWRGCVPGIPGGVDASVWRVHAVAINKVALHQGRLGLLLGWVTSKPSRYVTNHLGQLSLLSLQDG